MREAVAGANMIKNFSFKQSRQLVLEVVFGLFCFNILDQGDQLVFKLPEPVDGGGGLQGLEAELLLALSSLVGVEEEEGSPS